MRTLIIGMKKKKLDNCTFYPWDKIHEIDSLENYSQIVLFNPPIASSEASSPYSQFESKFNPESLGNLFFQNKKIIIIGEPSVQYIKRIVNPLTKVFKIKTENDHVKRLENPINDNVFFGDNHIDEMRWKSLNLSNFVKKISETKFYFSEVTCDAVKDFKGSLEGSHLSCSVSPIILTPSDNFVSFSLNFSAHDTINRNNPVPRGQVIFLPNIPDINEDETIQLLYLQLTGKPGFYSAEPPDWLNHIKNEKELQLEKDLNHTELQLEKLEAIKNDIVSKKIEEADFKKVLISNQTSLEERLILELKKLGFSLKDPKGDGKEDIVFLEDNITFICEVKSAERQKSHTDGLRQLLHWEVDYLIDDNIAPKLVYIYNYDPLTQPSQRTRVPQPLTDLLALKKNICLISVYELYLDLTKVKEGKLSIKELCSKINKCNKEYKS